MITDADKHLASVFHWLHDLLSIRPLGGTATLAEFLSQVSNEYRAGKNSAHPLQPFSDRIQEGHANDYYSAATALQRVDNVFKKEREGDPSFWKVELIDEEREVLDAFCRFRARGYSFDALLSDLVDHRSDDDVGARLRWAASVSRWLSRSWAAYCAVAQFREVAQTIIASKKLLASEDPYRAQVREREEEHAALRAEVERLRHALHRDRTGLANAIDAVRTEIRMRMWILDGRGPYEWDDEGYRNEAGEALRTIARICNEALVASGNLVQKELFPDALGVAPLPAELPSADVEALRAALASEKARADRAEEILQTARQFASHIEKLREALGST